MKDNEHKIDELIASNLVRLLREKNRTQLELAEYLGVTQAAVSNWCNGTKMPRMDKIDKICAFFDVKRSQLMFSSSIEEGLHVDELFIKKYGQSLFDIAMRYAALDRDDQIRISERIDMMLEDPKYKKDATSLVG